MNDLTQITAHQARALLDARQISAVDLTRAVLERAGQVEPLLNSYITLAPEEALDQAEAADAALREGLGGPFTGIPVMVKDNMSTRGVRTTAGSRMLERYVPPYDAFVVERLRGARAVIVGKGNMDEFAMGSSTENSAFGPTRNPWDTSRVPGGSSGGAAAGVAAGECLASLGSDTGGSIRQPAALCGIVGMKPTYGLVSRYGLIAFASSLDQIGPMTRDVRDCADLLTLIAGHDPRDSTSSPRAGGDYAEGIDRGVAGVRIGVPEEYLGVGLEPGVRAAFEGALDVLQDLGAEVEPTSLPLTAHALAVYYIIAPSEASANLARYDGFKYGYSDRSGPTSWEVMDDTRRGGFGAEVKRRILLGGYALSAGYYDAYYRKAQQVRTLIRGEFARAFERFDVLATPPSPTVAFRIGAKTGDPLQMYLSDVCTIPVNIAGLPGISVPCGMAGGLPVGLQVIGPQFGDATVLRVAYAWEQATEWHRLRPPL
ncbi:MAG: Asp-tRNA(Asn)/Glu-tRNA(Gln) amidotransferase subunit GatA [Gemmatimonadetes bacterium]|nr:Asp-tRNA(Asn)/Glu-tRNA(Gln) amidotransferase subunit GatA [Gemmatimonadota bacterium]